MNYEEALLHFSRYDEEVLILMAKIILAENNIEITDENIKLTIIQGAERELHGEYELN